MTAPNTDTATIECMIGITLQLKDREFLRSEVRLNGIPVGASSEEISQAVGTWAETFDAAKGQLLEKVTEYLSR